MNGRAIITFTRSWYTVSAIRSLGHRGVEIYAGDEIGLTPGSLSRYTVDSFRYPGPESQPMAFLDSFERTIRRLTPPDPETPYVMLPMHREAYLLAQHRERFEDLIAFALPDTAALDRVRDKRELVRLARERGVPTPRTWLPEHRDEIDAIAREATFPLFVKHPTGTGGVGLAKVQEPNELGPTVDHIGVDPMPLIQESIPGKDYCVSVLFDHGRRIASLTYRNVITFPEEGGPGAIRETADAPELEALTDRLLGDLGWHGIAQVDFRWTGSDEDEPALIEVNPRFFSGLAHAIASGVDYPWLMYRLALGETIDEPPEIDPGVRTEAPVVGLLATLGELLDEGTQIHALEHAWEESKAALRGDDSLRGVISRLSDALGETLDVSKRWHRLREVIDENRDNVTMLLDSEDPMPALGLLYPLAIFLQRGKLTSEMMVGTE